MYTECEKVAYGTRAEAEKMLSIIRNKHKPVWRNGRRVNSSKHVLPKRVYKCEICGKYHLTSKK